MRAAAGVVGVVGVAADALLLAGRVLQGDLDADVVRPSCRRRSACASVSSVRLRYSTNSAMPPSYWNVSSLPVALVGQLDGQALVEEGQLAEAVFERVVVEGGVVEDLRVGLEGDLGAGAAAWPAPMSLTSVVGLAALVLLHVDLAVAADLGLGPLAQGGDRLGADAVQAGRRLVRALVELGAGADGGQHHFERRPACPRDDRRRGCRGRRRRR